jgi:hypothetical protein
MERRTCKGKEELRQAAHHVSYEIEMLDYAADHLSGWESSPPWPHGNAAKMALESFLLHFRNLRAFLCPSLQHCTADDVLASDFLGKGDGADVGDTAQLGVDKTRLDKMLAHVTYSRSSYVEAMDYWWDIWGMLIVVFGELRKFLALLPPEQLAWFPIAESLKERQAQAQALVDRGR